jgi:hypothetical protein
MRTFSPDIDTPNPILRIRYSESRPIPAFLVDLPACPAL